MRFNKTSRKSRGDELQPTSFRQKLLALVTVCSLSAPQSADEVNGLQEFLADLTTWDRKPPSAAFAHSSWDNFQGKGSETVSSTKFQHTERAERQARKKLSPSCKQPLQADSSSAQAGSGKKCRRGKNNAWKRRVARCAVAASSQSTGATTSITSKWFTKVFSKSPKSGSAVPTAIPTVEPISSKVSDARSPPPSHGSSSIPLQPSSMRTTAHSSLAAHSSARLRPHPPSDHAAGGNHYALMQHIRHAGTAADVMSGSTRTPVAPSDPVGSPLLQDTTASDNSPPAQQEDAVALTAQSLSYRCLLQQVVTAPDHLATSTSSPSQATSNVKQDVTACSSPDGKHEASKLVVEPNSGVLVWILLLATFLLGWFGVQALRSALWTSAGLPPPPSHASASVNTLTVGLNQYLHTVLISWLVYISKAGAAMVLCYVVAFDCKAAFGVAASWAAAAAVAHYVGAAVEAALGCVSKLWVVATAVAQLLNDWMTAVLTFGLIILAAYLASAALTCLVQAVRMLFTQKETASAHTTEPEAGRCGRSLDSHARASSTTSSSSSSSSGSISSGDSPSNRGSALGSTQPASRGAWFWSNALFEKVLVENSIDKDLIKAVRAVPADPACTKALQDAAANLEKLSGLPPMACGKGCVGLRNWSLNCYANSVLQCLAAIPTFSQFYMSAEQGLGQPKRPVTAAMSALLHTMWASRAPVSPMPLLRTLGGRDARWSQGGQEDCQDFFATLLDSLQEESNQVKGQKPYRESLSGQGSAEEQADEAWQYGRSRCNSAIQEMFTGQMQSCVTCSSCGHQSYTFADFPSLSLTLPHKLGSNWLGVSMQEIFEEYSSPTQIEYRCDQCGAKQASSKQASVCRWPHILVLHLARFSVDEAVPLELRMSSSHKDQVPVSITETLSSLELNTLSASPACTKPPFDLIGIIDHEGGLHGGHYTARCKSAVDQSWWRCDDQHTERIAFDGGLSHKPYMLIYKRKD